MKKGQIKMIEWKLVTRKIEDLQKHPKNPRVLTKDQSNQLKKSIDKFGLIDKPVINLDNMIIGGHQRIQVLMQEGYNVIDCWVPNIQLTDKEVDELNIRLNKNNGDWDFDMLANEWNEEDLYQWGFFPEELGVSSIPEDVSDKEDKEEHKKPLKMCPQCGNEF